MRHLDGLCSGAPDTPDLTMKDPNGDSRPLDGPPLGAEVPEVDHQGKRVIGRLLVRVQSREQPRPPAATGCRGSSASGRRQSDESAACVGAARRARRLVFSVLGLRFASR